MQRRDLLALGLASSLTLHGPERSASRSGTVLPGANESRFRFCLNTSTISGQGLSLSEMIDVAAAAGYHGIEPWIRDIRREIERGTSTEELRTRLGDSGLTVECAIGFAHWIVDDEQVRLRALETAKRDMELVRQIGGQRIAAPPAGATQQTDLDLRNASDRYRKLLELGEATGVIPQLELWGFSKSLSRLSEVIYVAIECGHASASVLPDVYHLYKGGSDFQGLTMLSGKAVEVFHLNDYPARPVREAITDGDRVYPGDGVAPLESIIRTLHGNGFRGALSLELFNADYWSQDALVVAKAGLEKMKQVVSSALA